MKAYQTILSLILVFACLFSSANASLNYEQCMDRCILIKFKTNTMNHYETLPSDKCHYACAQMNNNACRWDFNWNNFWHCALRIAGEKGICWGKTDKSVAITYGGNQYVAKNKEVRHC